MKTITRFTTLVALIAGISIVAYLLTESIEPSSTQVGCGAIVTSEPVRLYHGTHSDTHFINEEFGPVTSYIETDEGTFLCILNDVCVDSRDVRLDKIWMLPSNIDPDEYFAGDGDKADLKKVGRCQISDLTKE